MAVTEDNAQNAGEQKQKHDEAYKDVLSDSESFIHFLKKYIAKPWTANISPDDVERVNKSFITEEYRPINSDLIYKLKINGSDVYFYVLIELQSEVDFTMPFRLLQYMVALLREIFNNTDKDVRERKDFRLPAIVPIVLYNGKDNWTAVMTFREYTGDYGIFGDNIIDFRYLLLDVDKTDEAAIEPIETVLDAHFSLEKLRIRKKLPGKLVEWWEEKTSGLSDDDKNKLINLIDLLVYKGKMPPEVRAYFQNSIKKGEETKMKFALETWMDEVEGEAMDKGRKQKALEIAKNFKAKGISVDDIAEATGLTVDDVLKL